MFNILKKIIFCHIISSMVLCYYGIYNKYNFMYLIRSDHGQNVYISIMVLTFILLNNI